MVINYREVKRDVVICFAQHRGPGSSVEEGGLVVGEKQVVPVGVVNRVDDLDVQFSLIGLLG